MKRKEITRGFVCRVCMIVAVLTILGCVLTSCGGTAAPTLTDNSDSIVTTEENGLTKSDLKATVGDIVKSKDAVTIRTQLVAALNGYDMTAEGFDDNNLPEAQPERSVEFAKNVLEKFEIEISGEDENMTVADLRQLIGAFKTTVNTEGSISFFAQILIWIAVAFEWMIRVLGFGNFILGTFFFAVVVEILMLPLAIHQQKNARKQARLRPKEMAIKKKYSGRNDQKTMQEMQGEIQEMYQKEGINQLSSGCLPLLISLPVIYALYYIVIDPLKYMMSCPAELASALTTFATAPKAAGGLGMVLQSKRGTIEILSLLKEQGTECIAALKDFQFFTNSATCHEVLNGILSAHTIPSFNLGLINFGLTPDITSPSWLLLIPVLNFGVYFGSMKLNRKMTYQPVTATDPNMGCSNTIMDVTMPAFSAFFTFMVPGAVGLYWIFKSIIGTAKQFLMNKVMPLPKFTEADYKAAEKELAAKEKGRPVKKPSGTRNPNVRSLHHIDDEDYATPAPQNGGKKGAKSQPKPVDSEPTTAVPETEVKSAEPETPRETLIGGAPLKEDIPAEERSRKNRNKKKKENQDEIKPETEIAAPDAGDAAGDATDGDDGADQA